MTAAFSTASPHRFGEQLLLAAPFLLHSLLASLPLILRKRPQHLLPSRSALVELPSVCPQDAVPPEGCFTGRGVLGQPFSSLSSCRHVVAMSGFKCDLVVAAVWLSSLCLWCVCCSRVWIGSFHHNWGIFSHYFFQYFYALILNVLCIINILLGAQ